MARILITGSADGLGSLAARQLIRRGHSVILHARNAERAAAARQACPGAEAVLIGDLSSIAATKKLAADANEHVRPAVSAPAPASASAPASAAAATTKPIDCVIHNAGLYRGPPARKPYTNAQGETMHIPALTAVNTIAPYILTCLMHRPRRLVYVTSGYHHNGDASLRDVAWQERGGGSRSGGGEDDDAAWSDLQAYADSKLHDVLLAKAFARRWGRGESSSSSVGEGRGVRSNALDPGWVPTKMGGASAPGSLDAAVETYVMLAEGADGGGGGGGGGDRAGKGSDGSGEGGDATGKLFGPRRKEIRSKAEADDVGVQDRLIEILEEITGVKFPE